jgi:hypothetical protein
MAATVQLKEIVEAMDMMFDQRRSFVNRETGEVVTVDRELLSSVEEVEEEEDDEEEDDEEDEEWQQVKDIYFNPMKYPRLPDKFEIHEWEIMRRFADSLQDRRIAGEVQDAIHGSGAFRMFKSTIRRLRIEQQWFAYRAEALAEIAREWCEEHGIPWK